MDRRVRLVSIKNLLTAREAAERLGLSVSTLYTPGWRRRYGLPAIKIGAALRFREGDLRVFVTRCREPREMLR
jgi:excisionase family DNA binding protein